MRLLNTFRLTALSMSLVSPVHAALIDRGNGLIYDTDLDITWLQDANYAKTSGYDSDGQMTWQEALGWADQLEYGGYSDWRLPKIESQYGDLTFAYDGTGALGYNITSQDNELAYMFYVNLGGIGTYDEAGNFTHNAGFTGPIPILNLHDSAQWYFSGNRVETPEYAGYTWVFNMLVGYNNWTSVNSEWYVWAVRDGNVLATPIPASLWLFGSGLIGLIVSARKKKALQY